MSVSLTEGSTTQLLEDLRMQKLDAVIGRCSTGADPCGPHAGDAVSAGGLLAGARAESVGSKGTHPACGSGRVHLVAAAAGNAQSNGDQRGLRCGATSAAVATVEAGSTKIIHLTISANSRMLGIVPSDVGHDIQRLGGVRHLPFPVALSMPPVGLVWATRHRDTPVVRNVRSNLRDLLRKRRAVQ